MIHLVALESNLCHAPCRGRRIWWSEVRAEIGKIPVRLTEIFERARREGRPTSAVADEIARERLGGGTPRQRRAPAQHARAL
jgi:leucine dehydrogenase